MTKSKSLIILGMPRSGTSLTANLCINAGYNPLIAKDSKFFGGSPFNKGGYYEEVRLTLLNDQIIRILYGKKFSFLYPPNKLNNKENIFSKNYDFQYDITDKNLDIPKDYKKNIIKYTGIKNDIWGLTRMLPGKRWHNGYSKFNVSNFEDIKKNLTIYSKKIKNGNNFLIKDPRLCFTLNQYSLKNEKIIIVKRKSQKHKKSLKRHYGPRFLSSKTYKDCAWVSNHFNLKISPISYKTFSTNYNNNIEIIKKTHKNFIEIDYEHIIEFNIKEISKLENFIEAKVDKSIIKVK